MIKIARFRLGSEMKEGRYWEGEEKRRCRLYGWELESWKYVMNVYMGEGKREGREEIIKILEDEREETWMKRLQGRKKREERGKKGKERREMDRDRRTMNGKMNE